MATHTLRPNADTSADTDWQDLPVAGDDYEKVDEASADDDSTYVYTSNSVSWLNELFELPDTLPAGPISNVRVYFRARLEASSSDFCIRARVQTGGVKYSGTETQLTTSYVDYYYDWATNPGTGEAWTNAQVDGMYAGVYGIAPSGGTIRCTQIYVVVTYTAATTSTTSTSTTITSTSI